MRLTFAQPGTFALIDGTWRRATFGPGQDDAHIIITDRSDFDDWSPEFELGRRWRATSSRGVVAVRIDAVDEVVKVSHHGRYLGAKVFVISGPKGGQLMVGMLSIDHCLAGKLGFGGNERDGFDKHIPVEAFVDVTEEITVKYRRGQGWLRG